MSQFRSFFANSSISYFLPAGSFVKVCYTAKIRFYLYSFSSSYENLYEKSTPILWAHAIFAFRNWASACKIKTPSALLPSFWSFFTAPSGNNDYLLFPRYVAYRRCTFAEASLLLFDVCYEDWQFRMYFWWATITVKKLCLRYETWSIFLPYFDCAKIVYTQLFSTQEKRNNHRKPWLKWSSKLIQ